MVGRKLATGAGTGYALDGPGNFTPPLRGEKGKGIRMEFTVRVIIAEDSVTVVPDSVGTDLLPFYVGFHAGACMLPEAVMEAFECGIRAACQQMMTGSR